jgi:subtilisin family serine protease
MASIHEPLVIARRTLLLVGWALVFVAMTGYESPKSTQSTSTRSPSRQKIEPMTETEAMSTAPSESTELVGQKSRVEDATVVDEDDEDESPGRRELRFVSTKDIPPTDPSGRPNCVPGQLIVRFRSGISTNDQRELIESLGAKIVSVIGPQREGAYLVALPDGIEVRDAAERFTRLEEVDYVEPEILHYTDAVPNDSLYASYAGQPGELQRWYYNGIGNDHNLNAEAAWDITTGNSNIVIAVIDTGVSLNHPDLQANIWINQREIAGNGIDDDRNGYADDVRGWDFYNNDNDPSPDLGTGNGDGNVFHGTFVAGCAAAVGDNGAGVAGASWRSRIMPLKVFTSSGGAPSSAIANALRYAADNGANIVNMSFGSSYTSFTISDAVNYAWSKGLLLVASAGNGNSNQPQYPARYPNVISVGGSGGGSRYGNGSGNITSRASFTQYGTNAVDVVAPAVDIVSTALYSVSDEANGWGKAGSPTYFFGNGTSFAAPLVAGEAALLMSRAQNLGLGTSLNNVDFRRYVTTSTVTLPDDPTDSPDAGPTWANHGRVDFLVALQRVGPKPNAAGNVVARALGRNTVQLTWQDSANNEQSYRIKRAVVSGSVIGPYQILGTLPQNTTAFTDATAQPATSYLYRVIAINASGRGVVTSTVVTTPP